MRIFNKRAKFDYKLLDKHEGGIVLLGGEVKAARRGRVDLSRSYAKVIDGEVYLINASIPIEGKKDYNPSRTRKLLLHKKEVVAIDSKTKAKKLTLVPTKMYTKGRLIKVEIALAKAKRKFEKKEAIKKKDLEREMAQTLKNEKT